MYNMTIDKTKPPLQIYANRYNSRDLLFIFTNRIIYFNLIKCNYIKYLEAELLPEDPCNNNILFLCIVILWYDVHTCTCMCFQRALKMINLALAPAAVISAHVCHSSSRTVDHFSCHVFSTHVPLQWLHKGQKQIAHVQWVPVYHLLFCECLLT